jgi:CheY-like chemotaxis protein/two-component sensor histidine kinase
LPYLRYIAESIHSLADAKDVKLRVESSRDAIVMDYDPERLLQIAHNLLSNAIKFTPAGGEVVMKLETGTGDMDEFPISNSQFQISVSDTGVGIAPEELPFVFDRFFQAKNQEKTKSGGTGIGLSLTRELVRAMEGNIAAESKVGVGTTFRVVLPVTNNAAFAAEPVPGAGFVASEGLAPFSGAESIANRAEAGSHLLIIEDNPDVVEYLAACLGRQYRLDFAYNGQSGIDKAIATVPDLIISDVMMPEKDGFEVCEALRNDERSSHIPIVLLTARAGVEDRIAGLRRGADAYLAKPFHPEELRVTLLKLIEMRRSLQARYAVVADAPAPAVNEAEKTEDAFLQKLRSAVESHLSDPGFSGEELCRALGMSYPVVYRKLSALTGRSLNVYIRLIRLQKARDMLLSSALGIAEIAYETGFNDPKFFSRVFSEEFGMPPSVFREKMGK